MTKQSSPMESQGQAITKQYMTANWIPMIWKKSIPNLISIIQPEGFTGHSLSISDVIELYDEDNSTFHLWIALVEPLHSIILNKNRGSRWTCKRNEFQKKEDKPWQKQPTPRRMKNQICTTMWRFKYSTGGNAQGNSQCQYQWCLCHQRHQADGRFKRTLCFHAEL